MQNNSHSSRESGTKTIPRSELPGLRAKTCRIDETTPVETTKSFAAGVVTDCVRLYVRKEPSADGEVVTVIDCLSKVMVDMDASANDFYKICTAAGVEGFCMRKYIALKR